MAKDEKPEAATNIYWAPAKEYRISVPNTERIENNRVVKNEETIRFSEHVVATKDPKIIRIIEDSLSFKDGRIIKCVDIDEAATRTRGVQLKKNALRSQTHVLSDQTHENYNINLPSNPELAVHNQ